MRRTLLTAAATTILAVSLLAGCGGGDKIDAPRPNIIVLMVDALRADHVGCYGYDRDTSPYLDSLAARGVVFERAYAQASQTKLSVASLMTGLNPPSHHVREAELASTTGDTVLSDVLSEELETLAERLQGVGYTTAGFVTNPHLEPGQGFDQGFDHYVYTDYKHCMADRLGEQVTEWLAAQEGTEPWFVYAHYMDVHAPYRPPTGYQYYSGEFATLKPMETNGPPDGPVNMERITRTVNLYDGQINYWDDQLEALVAGLPGGEALENTLVIVVSDHGDEFYEHGGFGHGYTVYDGVIHVPLVTVGGGQAAGVRRSDPVRLTDLLPTLCKLAGAPADTSRLEGFDLFAAGREQGVPGLEIYAEAVYGKRPRSVRKDGDFLIFNPTTENWEYYDLRIDPYQQINLWTERRGGLSALRGDLDRLRTGKGLIAAPERTALDKETVDALKSLGY